MHDKFLKGRTALVTGGASGMGRAMALAFAKAGANVAIGSLLSTRESKNEHGELVHKPTQEQLDKTAKEIEEHGVKSITYNLDVTCEKSVKNFYDKALDAFDKIDILANAAGITAEQTICGHEDALWNKVMDVNLNGTYRTIKLCLPSMMEQKWGRIINIASTAASVGAPTSAAYCASKAGVVALSKCVALEGAERNITCNTISPGWVQTNFGTNWMTHIGRESGLKKHDDYIKNTKAENPQKRLIQPKEIGGLALYLCSDEALGITMQDLTISGGSLW